MLDLLGKPEDSLKIIFFFWSFGISEYIWSISNILYVKNHLLNSILIIWPLWEYEPLIKTTQM